MECSNFLSLAHLMSKEAGWRKGSDQLRCFHIGSPTCWWFHISKGGDGVRVDTGMLSTCVLRTVLRIGRREYLTYEIYKGKTLAP
jgi:hypothetical protein